ncbi:hypothetical protein GCM10022223_11870 [Kineosporia mesophila]|uniref:Transposase n=1 Tax=Kineosporia mesophila TaxID=566012 RepID=A0ABP6Z7R7_9ACTN
MLRLTHEPRNGHGEKIKGICENKRRVNRVSRRTDRHHLAAVCRDSQVADQIADARPGPRRPVRCHLPAPEQV